MDKYFLEYRDDNDQWMKHTLNPDNGFPSVSELMRTIITKKNLTFSFDRKDYRVTKEVTQRIAV